MNILKTARRLKKFMEATEIEVCELFLTLPNAVALDYKGSKKPIVFIPGTRKDRVLLVAHYDTVFADKPNSRKVIIDGTMMYSGKDNVGIGADNRAGCCMLWMMRTLGHSLLLVPDEEIGCLGSSHVADNYPEILKDHQFMIQFDRRGSTDLVYYDTETEEFNDYMEMMYPGYTRDQGSFTDIAELVPAANCAGVNVSIGFFNEHRASESLDVCDFIRTAHNTLKLLQLENLPYFEPDLSSRKVRNYGYGYGYSNSYLGTYGVDDLDEATEFFNEYNIDKLNCPDCGTEINPDNFDDTLYLHTVEDGWCGVCYSEFNIPQTIKDQKKKNKDKQEDIFLEPDDEDKEEFMKDEDIQTAIVKGGL